MGVSALAPKPSATATPIRPMMSFSAFACATPCCRRLLPSVCVALADVSASLCQETVHVREHADDAGVARLLDPAEQDARAAALFLLTAQRVSFRTASATKVQRRYQEHMPPLLVTHSRGSSRECALVCTLTVTPSARGREDARQAGALRASVGRRVPFTHRVNVTLPSRAVSHASCIFSEMLLTLSKAAGVENRRALPRRRRSHATARANGRRPLPNRATKPDGQR